MIFASIYNLMIASMSHENDVDDGVTMGRLVHYNEFPEEITIVRHEKQEMHIYTHTHSLN